MVCGALFNYDEHSQFRDYISIIHLLYFPCFSSLQNKKPVLAGAGHRNFGIDIFYQIKPGNRRISHPLLPPVSQHFLR